MNCSFCSKVRNPWGAGKRGGGWAGSRGEQNCGRLPSVTYSPNSDSNSSNKTSHKMPNMRCFLEKKKKRLGPGYWGADWEEFTKIQKVTAERYVREEDAGLIAHGVEASNVTGSYYCQPYFCTVRNQNLFFRCWGITLTSVPPDRSVGMNRDGRKTSFRARMLYEKNRPGESLKVLPWAFEGGERCSCWVGIVGLRQKGGRKWRQTQQLCKT